MLPPRRAGLPAACLLLVLSMLTACGGGADTPSAQTAQTGAARSADAEAVQALQAAAGADAPAQVNLAMAPDLRTLAARAATPDLMLDTESTP